MIRFLLNDQLIQTSSPDTMVALDFVREHQRLMGTKTGCREGDCGACTVLVGELRGGKVQYRSMTSCLLPLGNLHGKHLVTVEGLNLPDLNRAQRAIVENGGTQCGFCTVGFVVSLAGHCLTDGATTYEQGIAAIDGNICRCTGYKSLERAVADLTGELQARPKTDALGWLGDNGFVPAYFTTVAQRLTELVGTTNGQSGTPANAPVTVPTVFTAGGTDLMVQRPEAMLKATAELLFDRPALKGITRTGDTIRIGAAVTAQEMMDSDVLAGIFPRLRAHLKLVSSTPIRQMGTLGGNLCNASPIGDLTAFFLALNSTLTIARPEGQRQLPLRAFYTGYKQLAKEPTEWVEAISFTAPGPDARFSFEKVSKRTHLDIASVNSAALLTVRDGRITEAHLSAGGVSATPKYLTRTAEFLHGKEVTPATLRAANEIAQAEIAPISDARGTEAYKRLLLRQLLWAHFITLYPEHITAGELLGR